MRQKGNAEGLPLWQDTLEKKIIQTDTVKSLNNAFRCDTLTVVQ